MMGQFGRVSKNTRYQYGKLIEISKGGSASMMHFWDLVIIVWVGKGKALKFMKSATS